MIAEQVSFTIPTLTWVLPLVGLVLYFYFRLTLPLANRFSNWLVERMTRHYERRIAELEEERDAPR